MYFDRNKQHTLTSIYGTRNVTRGRIVSCGAHPKSIVGAKIDVIHIINGKRHLIKTGLKSRPGGKLTLILPSNLTESEHRVRLPRSPRFHGGHIEGHPAPARSARRSGGVVWR